MPTRRTSGCAAANARTEIATELSEDHKRVQAATAQRKRTSGGTAPGKSGGTDKHRS